MSSITLEGFEKLQRNLSLAEREVFRPAASRSINRTGDRVRTLTKRSVAQTMGVKQASVKRRLELIKTRPQSIDRGALLKVRGNALNLSGFGARQTQRGVSAAPWGKRRIFPTAFLVRIRGTRLVMVRRKIGGKRVARLPIRPVLGPGIAKTAMAEELTQEREEFIADFLPTELSRQLDLLMRRRFR